MIAPTSRFAFLVLFSLLWSQATAPEASGALTAGSLAIIGYDDSNDVLFSEANYITLATLAPIAAGEVVYLTDNGWFGSAFRGAGTGADQGPGVESLSRLTFNVAVPAGTVISTFDSNPDYTWTLSGNIGFISATSLGDYSPPTINSSPLAAGPLNDAADTLYLFQSLDTNNPLFDPSTFVYAMHKGTEFDTGFSATVSDQTGEVPPGLSEGANTAVVHFDSMAPLKFNDNLYTLNASAPAVAALQSAGGTPAQWLAVIADATNWEIGTYTSSTTLPSNSPSLLNVVIPEPDRAMLLLGACAAITLRRRR